MNLTAYGEHVDSFSAEAIAEAQRKLTDRLRGLGLDPDGYQFRRILAWDVSRKCQIRRIDALPREAR